MHEIAGISMSLHADPRVGIQFLDLPKLINTESGVEFSSYLRFEIYHISGSDRNDFSLTVPIASIDHFDLLWVLLRLFSTRNPNQPGSHQKIPKLIFWLIPLGLDL